MLQPIYKYLDDKTDSPRKEISIDIITWTEQVLFDQYPNFMNRMLFICLVTIAQLSALPDLAFVVSGKDSLSLLLVSFGSFWEKPKAGSRVKLVYLIRILCVFPDFTRELVNSCWRSSFSAFFLGLSCFLPSPGSFDSFWASFLPVRIGLCSLSAVHLPHGVGLISLART